MRDRAAVVLVVALSALLAAGCSDKGSYQLMAAQPRYEPLEAGPRDGLGVARHPPAGTVARGHLQLDALLYTGMADGQPAVILPFPASRAVLARGHERFNIYCAPCHGEDGYGRGPIVQRGFSPPPSLHADRLRQAPVGHIFRVATLGYGAMPEYAKQTTPEDRWAIAAYVRALQLSQHASIADIPDALRQLPAAGGGR
jgi:mono/diheme cytochrome c family protein